MRKLNLSVFPLTVEVILALIVMIVGAGAIFAIPLTDVPLAAIDTAIHRVKPSLVRIHVVTLEHRQGREIKYESSGSGTIISRQGHVVTNHHVAGKATRIVCTLANKEELEADLTGTDALSDISVIKLRSSTPPDFPAAQFGNSTELRVGQHVLAMGSPLSLSQSVTYGIVSNTEMIMPRMFWPFNKLTLDGEDVGSVVRWIAHDAVIFPGNSGGPLVNLQGEIVGINEIGLGLGGAIPGNLAKDVVEQLINKGRVRRSWIGLEFQPLLKSQSNAQGALVSGTIQGSPAEKAGFQPGDFLLRLNGEPINVRFAEEQPPANQRFMNLPIGQEAFATVLRNGQEKTLRVSPIERENVRAKTVELKPWGIAASNLTLWAEKEMKRTNRDGVLVKNVRPGGPCEEAKPSIAQNDIIVEVAGLRIRRLDDLLETTEKITAGKSAPTPVLVAFERSGERFLTVAKLGLQNPEDAGLEARKAWLPASLQVLTRELAEALGHPGRTGVRVTQVYPDSPAAKAGLRAGDLIVELDGQGIPASQPEEIDVFPTMIRQYKIGSLVELTVLRGKEEIKIKVELGVSPKLPREMKKYRDNLFDFTARDLALSDQIQQQLKDEPTGLWVEEVSEGGWAALAHLAVGDRILGIDGQSIAEATALETRMKEIAEKKPRSVVLQVRRGIHNLYLEMEPDWKK